jgi:hypothetical protein
MLHQTIKIFFIGVLLLSSQVGYGSQYNDDARQRKMAEQNQQLDELLVQAVAQRSAFEVLDRRLQAQNNQQRPTQDNQQRSNTISQGKKNITVKHDGVGLIVMNGNILAAQMHKENEFLNFMGSGSRVTAMASDNVEKIFIKFDEQSYNNHVTIYLSSKSNAKIFMQDELKRLAQNNKVDLITRNNNVLDQDKIAVDTHSTGSLISYPLIISGIGVMLFYWIFLKK